jgi:molybdopterin-containing oxidoreductase family iron-sulfur binding subunit
MNRLYALECMPTSTGVRADHRLPLRAGDIVTVASQIAAAVGVSGLGTPAASNPASKWVDAIAKDLRAHRGSSLVVAGDGQPAIVHALAHAMNQTLGSVGRTLVYTDPIEGRRSSAPVASRSRRRHERRRGGRARHRRRQSQYTSPADIALADAMTKSRFECISACRRWTSALCHWQIRKRISSNRERRRAYDGTVSSYQPLIAPLYGGRSAHELLAAMSDRPEQSGYDIVRQVRNRTQPVPRVRRKVRPRRVRKPEPTTDGSGAACDAGLRQGRRSACSTRRGGDGCTTA